MNEQDMAWMAATSRGLVGRFGTWCMRPPLLPRTPGRMARLYAFGLLLRVHRWLWLRLMKV